MSRAEEIRWRAALAWYQRRKTAAAIVEAEANTLYEIWTLFDCGMLSFEETRNLLKEMWNGEL